ncbi:hypothetical protein I7I48_05831 [Histoplasma ohiense]|nr:hypothetical protein I7I48_05831 [Histoplasma ohiense (nom. inval.)]
MMRRGRRRRRIIRIITTTMDVVNGNGEEEKKDIIGPTATMLEDGAEPAPVEAVKQQMTTKKKKRVRSKKQTIKESGRWRGSQPAPAITNAWEKTTAQKENES